MNSSHSSNSPHRHPAGPRLSPNPSPTSANTSRIRGESRETLNQSKESLMPPPQINYQPMHQQASFNSEQTAFSIQPRNDKLARKRTVKNIPLTAQGHLVIDIPVPDRVLHMGKFQTGDEFTYMRYTAATCDANDFSLSGYALRQQEYGRITELFIVITMYNEDEVLFCKSVAALMRNIAYLCSRNRSKTWGADGWKKAVICIVSDGRAKCNLRVLNVLGIMGIYQEGIMKESVNGRPVSAHIFEYTTQVCVTSELKIQGFQQGFVPVQMLFCLKEKNAKKINSHRWFFNAFGPLIRPNVCGLIDVGTKPSNTSLYHLWKAFDREPYLGGACGEIFVELGNGCSNLLNPLVAVQNFEYKMSNILDKPLESVMGYIGVLPGAFSAYRYAALQGAPLQQYFMGETMHDGADIAAANMYLAEDRILCFETVTKRNESWLLKYVKSAKAETDVPDTVPEFISQRRRWINGSFFAGVHALTHWYYIFRANHNLARKILLLTQFLYNFISLIFSWFSLAFFYLVFYFLAQGSIQSKSSDPFYGHGSIVFQVLRELYLMSIVLIVVTSLGNRPQGSKWIFIFSMVLFTFIMMVTYYLVAFTIYQVIISMPSSSLSDLFSRSQFRDIIISMTSTYGLYFLSSLIYLEPWHMFTSFFQYMLFLPSFINILNVYAFCNLHDVSWGTKGDNTATALAGVTSKQDKDGKQMVEVEMPTDRDDINNNYEKFVRALRQPRPVVNQSRDAKTKQEDYFRNFRTRVVLLWLLTNALVIIILTSSLLQTSLYSMSSSQFNPFLTFLFYAVLGLSSIRFIGSMTYLVTKFIGR